MRKRQKLVLTAVMLSLGMVGVQQVGLEYKYWFVLGLAILNWVLAAWSLREGLLGIEWLTVVLPPVTFTASVGLFYVLLPQSIWARIAIVLLYGLGQYALLLTANIFSVAAIRTIALFRAASAVGFVMTLLTGFFVFDTILSFRLPFWAVGLGVTLVAATLILPSLWSVELAPKLEKKVLVYTLFLAVGTGLVSMAVAFWPISIAVYSLFLCTTLYIFIGVTQHHFANRLFTKTIWEYVTVGGVVLITMLLTAGWGV